MGFDQIASKFGPEFLLKLYLAGAIGGSVFYLGHQSYKSLTSKVQWWLERHCLSANSKTFFLKKILGETKEQNLDFKPSPDARKKLSLIC